jgi:hypothetical protein
MVPIALSFNAPGSACGVGPCRDECFRCSPADESRMLVAYERKIRSAVELHPWPQISSFARTWVLGYSSVARIPGLPQAALARFHSDRTARARCPDQITSRWQLSPVLHGERIVEDPAEPSAAAPSRTQTLAGRDERETLSHRTPAAPMIAITEARNRREFGNTGWQPPLARPCRGVCWRRFQTSAAARCHVAPSDHRMVAPSGAHGRSWPIRFKSPRGSRAFHLSSGPAPARKSTIDHGEVSTFRATGLIGCRHHMASANRETTSAG